MLLASEIATNSYYNITMNILTKKVRWRAPVDENQNGIIRAYQIYIQPKKTVKTSISNSEHAEENNENSPLFIPSQNDNDNILMTRMVFISTTVNHYASTLEIQR